MDTLPVFENLWTDNADAPSRLSQKLATGEITANEAEALRQFIDCGYVIIPNAITAEQADQLVQAIESTKANPTKFLARTRRSAYSNVTPDVLDDKAFRLIDFHVNTPLAREAQFSPAVRRLLELIFGEPALAFQSLTFKYGSQQGIHQDGAYVVVSEPLKFAASWIALEDVAPGSGELVYYPGSHKLPHFLFSNRYKSWLPKRDGEASGQLFTQHLKQQIEEKKLERQVFAPKKGDCLIWAADLVHGGAKITNDHTRFSLVTHYCPVSVSPNYASFFNGFEIAEHGQGCFYSSRHYDLRAKKPNLIRRVNSLRNRGTAQLLEPAFRGR